MKFDIDKDIARQIEAKRVLYPDFISLGCWRFMHLDSGKMYDLSAADLTQIGMIVRDGHFLIK